MSKRRVWAELCVRPDPFISANRKQTNMKTNLRKTVVLLLQTFSLALGIVLATFETTFAQGVTFTKITTGSIATDRGSFGGPAWGDYNNDGFEDLFVPNFGSRNDYLYQNTGTGTFTRITSGPLVNDGRDGASANWCDYNNDGHLDLFLSGVSGGTPNSNLLYHNQGNGTFTKITSGNLVTEIQSGAMYGSAWGDFDNDGFIDLFVATTSPQDLLYRNNGAGGFDRIFTGPIPNQGSGVSLGSAWGDYNNDGKLDLFVATDQGNNFLYRNEGNGAFTTITTAPVGTDGGSSVNSVGCAWGDYNNDGFLDLFVSNGGDVTPSVNFLYQNTGTGTFTRATSGAIATDLGYADGCAWGDYDNDGFLDVFVCRYIGNNSLYRNNGDGTFSKITTGSPVNEGGDAIASVWGDYDNDGFLDLFVTRGSTSTASDFTNILYHNDGNTNQWLKIKCVGGPSNRAAIGAKVRVQARTSSGGLTWQMREISGGHGIGQNSLIAHFGLGAATNAQTVRIEWPSGIVQVMTNVAAKQFLTVIEPPLLQAGRTNGSFQISLTGSLGLSYGIEASTNFAGWILVGCVTNTARTVRFADPGATNHPQRFYRAVLK